MKVGFTPTEAYSMFRSLRREVFNYFSYEHPITFGVRSASTGIFNYSSIAHCDFSDDPETPWMPGDRINKFATGIRIDAHYLPHLYEDELINIFLHELTHATAGHSAMHGSSWAKQASEVGAVPLPDFLMRNWSKVYDQHSYLYSSARDNFMRNGATMDQWKNRTLYV